MLEQTSSEQTIRNYLQLLGYDAASSNVLLEVAVFLKWSQQIAYIVFQRYSDIIKRILKSIQENNEVTEGLLIHIVNDAFLYADHLLSREGRKMSRESLNIVEIISNEDFNGELPLPYKVVTYNFVQVLIELLRRQEEKDVVEGICSQTR